MFGQELDQGILDCDSHTHRIHLGREEVLGSNTVVKVKRGGGGENTKRYSHKFNARRGTCNLPLH